MVDVWRLRNPTDVRYSWQNSNGTKASRIDFILITKGSEALCENCMYFQGLMTDHSAQLISIKDQQFERGPGYWKCNFSIFQREELLEKCLEVKRDVDAIRDLSSKAKWEALKKRLICTLKRMSRVVADEKKLLISCLSEKVCEI